MSVTHGHSKTIFHNTEIFPNIPGPTDQKPVEQDGMYVLPRKRMDEDEVKYSAVVRRVSSKNKRRDRSKKIQVRTILHLR